MTSVQVIVDDAIEDDSILDFEGSWETGGIQIEFNGTTRYTRTGGASNTLHFDGSSVQLFATQLDGYNTLNLSYAIDSGTSKAVQLTENGSLRYHQTFVQVDVPDGQHTLTTTLDGQGIMFCVDYFLYTTTLERIVELKKPVTVLVDDSNTANIVYGGPWVAVSTRGTALGHTEHITSSAGSNATFNFYGTYVGVVGSASAATASSTYIIDDGTPVIFNSPRASPLQSGQKLFEQTLEDGPHSLVITLQNDAEFGLDYILYKPSLSEAVYVRPFPSSPSAAATALTLPTPSESESPGDISSSHAGAIVGGVIGGILGSLAIALVILFFFCRKRRSAPQFPSDDNTTTGRGCSPVVAQDFDPLSLYLSSTAANPVGGVPPHIASGKMIRNGIQDRAQDSGIRVLASADEESLRPPTYRPDYPTSRIKT